MIVSIYIHACVITPTYVREYLHTYVHTSTLLTLRSLEWKGNGEFVTNLQANRRNLDPLALDCVILMI